MQLRAALLEEVRLAAATLLESSKFSVGIATAISAHISASLVSSSSLFGSKQLARQVMYLEHARLMDVQPLRVLLHFLWTQLGFRWMFLPHNQKTEDLLVVVKFCPVSLGSTVFAAGTMCRLCKAKLNNWKLTDACQAQVHVAVGSLQATALFAG